MKITKRIEKLKEKLEDYDYDHEGDKWDKADKIQVAFILKTDKETKTFKGVLDLYGIVRGVV